MNNEGLEIIDYDICVVGGGVCGMFFATKFHNSDKKIAIIENSDHLGGQLNLYKDKHIYNIPLITEIKSCDVIEKLNNDLSKQENCNIIFETKILDVKKQNKNKQDIFLITLFNKITKKNTYINCKYLVISTGKGEEIPNKLQTKNAENYENKNIFYSVENEEKFKDKDIIIAGGGDSVIDWAVELSNISKSIAIVHRREINKIDNPNFLKFQKLYKEEKILLKYPFVINNILKDNNNLMIGIEIKNIENEQIEKIKCDSLLVFYGMKTIQSNNNILNKLEVDYSLNGIKVDYRTNCVVDKNGNCIDNIFAIGDCCDFEGKVKNIIASFVDGIRCYYKICKTEKVVKYEHK